MRATAIDSTEWIPIGQSADAEELEQIISTLKARWASRYSYRIERCEGRDDAPPYELLLKHR